MKLKVANLDTVNKCIETYRTNGASLLHNIESARVNGGETFVSLKLEGQSGVQTRD